MDELRFIIFTQNGNQDLTYVKTENSEKDALAYINSDPFKNYTIIYGTLLNLQKGAWQIVR